MLMKYCVLNVHKKGQKLYFHTVKFLGHTNRLSSKAVYIKQQQLLFVLFLVVFAQGSNKLSHKKRNMVLYIFIYNGSYQRHTYNILGYSSIWQ